jgi:hypothetical protein
MAVDSGNLLIIYPSLYLLSYGTVKDVWTLRVKTAPSTLGLN